MAFDRCLNAANIKTHTAVDNIYMLKNKNGTVCHSTDLGCTRDSCQCRDHCCEEKTNTCFFHRRLPCGVNESYDPSRGAEIASPLDFTLKCCKPQPTCDTFTCPAGWKSKSPVDACGSSCEPQNCCEYDLTTCFGRQGVGDTCSNRTRKYVGTTARVVGLVANNFDEKCCADQELGCQSFSCPDHMVKRAGADNLYVAGHSAVCCECKANVCCGKLHLAPQCGDTHFVDPDKHTNVVKSDDSDFKSQCCTLLTDCAITWNAFGPPLSSAKRRTVAVAMPLSLFAALAFR